MKKIETKNFLTENNYQQVKELLPSCKFKSRLTLKKLGDLGNFLYVAEIEETNKNGNATSQKSKFLSQLVSKLSEINENIENRAI